MEKRRWERGGGEDKEVKRRGRENGKEKASEKDSKGVEEKVGKTE